MKQTTPRQQGTNIRIAFVSGRFPNMLLSRGVAMVLLALTLTIAVSSCARKDLGNGDIFDAAKRGDVEKVEALLEDNPSGIQHR